MSLFRNGRGIAIQDKHARADQRQVQRDKGKVSFFLGFRRKQGKPVLNKMSLEKDKGPRLWTFHIGCWW